MLMIVPLCFFFALFHCKCSSIGALQGVEHVHHDLLPIINHTLGEGEGGLLICLMFVDN
jgi:hypothetical protein